MTMPEKRNSPRFKISLAAKIVSLNREAVSLDVQTLDIGGGGVRISSGSELPIGGSAQYVITLSENNPPAKIYCAGRVLRCTKNEDSWDAALTMARYSFIRSSDPHRQDCRTVTPAWRIGKQTGTPDIALADRS